MVRQPKSAALNLDNLADSVAPIFQQAQFSLANHRKNVVALHKIHEQAAEITEAKGKNVQLTGEAAFNKCFQAMVNHALPLKKGVSQGDKVIKFAAAFVRYSSEKGKHTLSRSSTISLKLRFGSR